MNSTKQYIEEAKKISELSDDPSTKVGCVIVKDGKIVGESFNHWPEEWKSSPIWNRGNGAIDDLDSKYPYVIHAEADAISKSTADLHGAIIYVTLFPCNNCAKCIISSGIKKIVYVSDKYADQNTFKASRKLLSECGVEMEQYND